MFLMIGSGYRGEVAGQLPCGDITHTVIRIRAPTEDAAIEAESTRCLSQNWTQDQGAPLDLRKY
jgi:hypothetical protein